MTLEYQILQRLGSGPVLLSTLGDIGDDDLERMLTIMAARRQICVRDRQVSLFWHRHMISRAGGVVHGGGVAFA